MEFNGALWSLMEHYGVNGALWSLMEHYGPPPIKEIRSGKKNTNIDSRPRIKSAIFLPDENTRPRYGGTRPRFGKPRPRFLCRDRGLVEFSRQLIRGRGSW